MKTEMNNNGIDDGGDGDSGRRCLGDAGRAATVGEGVEWLRWGELALDVVRGDVSDEGCEGMDGGEGTDGLEGERERRLLQVPEGERERLRELARFGDGVGRALRGEHEGAGGGGRLVTRERAGLSDKQRLRVLEAARGLGRERERGGRLRVALAVGFSVAAVAVLALFLMQSELVSANDALLPVADDDRVPGGTEGVELTPLFLQRDSVAEGELVAWDERVLRPAAAPRLDWSRPLQQRVLVAEGFARDFERGFLMTQRGLEEDRERGDLSGAEDGVLADARVESGVVGGGGEQEIARVRWLWASSGLLATGVGSASIAAEGAAAFDAERQPDWMASALRLAVAMPQDLERRISAGGASAGGAAGVESVLVPWENGGQPDARLVRVQYWLPTGVEVGRVALGWDGKQVEAARLLHSAQQQVDGGVFCTLLALVEPNKGAELDRVLLHVRQGDGSVLSWHLAMKDERRRFSEAAPSMVLQGALAAWELRERGELDAGSLEDERLRDWLRLAVEDAEVRLRLLGWMGLDGVGWWGFEED